MNSRTFLATLAIVCLIAAVSAQSSANPISSLQQKASSIAASATNTAAATPTQTNAGISLTSSPIMMQVLILACAFVASSYLI